MWRALDLLEHLFIVLVQENKYGENMTLYPVF